jgi:hypothetical protein
MSGMRSWAWMAIALGGLIAPSPADGGERGVPAVTAPPGSHEAGVQRAGRSKKRSRPTQGGGSIDPTYYDQDCIAECSKKQKDCGFDCSRVSGDEENKSCDKDCVAAYVRCGKACPPRK